MAAAETCLLPPRVHLLPELFEPADLESGVAVVIDVLRASTTMIAALDAGATRILPCATVEEAQAHRARLGRAHVLLGGERGGELIRGFDLDNSPRAYAAPVVQGQTIAFTTTNGTRALRRSRQADRVLVGAFTNRGALLEILRRESRQIHLVCAGTDGQITSEDVLLAGSLAGELLAARPSLAGLPIATQLATVWARSLGPLDDATVLEQLRDSAGGRNLIELGYDADIAFASCQATSGVVPEFDHRTGELRPLGRHAQGIA